MNEMFFYDTEELVWRSKTELMLLYERMRAENEILEESFEEWLGVMPIDVALEPYSCGLLDNQKVRA